jgi:hypothetical protein
MARRFARLVAVSAAATCRELTAQFGGAKRTGLDVLDIFSSCVKS